MVYGVILASGVGNRMKSEIPKQFLELSGVPILAYTVWSFLQVRNVDEIILVCHPNYLDHARSILDKYFDPEQTQNILLIPGGKERIDSIDNAVKDIVSRHAVEEDDVIIIHDAVRPFVTKRILEDSIIGAREKNAVVAGLPAIDTMLFSEDGERVDDIPDRSKLFNGQAPDSFRLKFFIQLRDNLTEEEKKEVFGTSKLCELNHVPIFMIPGDELNFKITTPSDLKKAEFYLSLMQKENNESFKFTRSK